VETRLFGSQFVLWVTEVRQKDKKNALKETTGMTFELYFNYSASSIRYN
jgi:hypothetical protein